MQWTLGTKLQNGSLTNANRCLLPAPRGCVERQRLAWWAGYIFTSLNSAKAPPFLGIRIVYTHNRLKMGGQDVDN